MSFITRKSIFKLFLILLLLGTCSVGLLCILIQKPSVQNYLLEKMGEVAGYRITAKKIDVNYRSGIGLKAQGIVGTSLVSFIRVESDRLDVTFGFKELLVGRFVPKRISIFRPRIEFDLEKPPKKAKETPIGAIIAASLSGLRFGLIEQANVNVKGFPFNVQHLDFEICSIKRIPLKLQIQMSGEIVCGDENTPFSMQGTITSKKLTGGDFFTEINFKTDNLPLALMPWPRSVHFRKGIGSADLRLVSTLGGPVSAEGSIIVKDVHFSVHRKEREKQYCSDLLKIDISAFYADKKLEISSLKLKGSDFSLTAKSVFDFHNTSNPHIFFSLETPFVPLKVFKRIFPANLVRPWVENEILSIVTGGQARLKHFSMNGTCDQYKHLNLPENANVITLKVDWKDISVFENSLALPFRNVWGGFTLKNGASQTAIDGAVFGNSSVNRASLSSFKDHGKRVFCITVDGLFELSDLIQQEKMHFIPEGTRKRLELFQHVSGKLEGSVEVCFDQNWTNPRINKGHYYGKNCMVTHKSLGLPLSIAEMELQINVKNENRFQCSGHWGKTEFEIKGVTDDQWEYGCAQLVSRIHCSEIINRFNPQAPIRLESNHLVPVKATLSRKDKVWDCQGKIELDGVSMDSHTFRISPPGKNNAAVFFLRLYPNDKLSLENLKFILGNSSIDLSGFCNLENIEVVNLKVLSEKLRLEDLGFKFREQTEPSKGVVSGKVKIKKFMKTLPNVFVVGKVIGKDISFSLDKLPSKISACHFDVDFLGQDIDIRSFKMKVGESPLEISGVLRGWDGFEGELEVDSSILVLSDFKPNNIFYDSEKSIQSPFVQNSDVRFVLTARKGRWKKLLFSPLYGEISLRSGDLFVKRIEAALINHGSFILEGQILNRDEPEKLSFTTEIRIKELAVEELLYSIGIDRKVLDGPITADIKLSSKGKTKEDLISALQGNSHFRIGKGRINSAYGILFKILDVLNIQNLIKGRLPDLTKESFPFESIGANVSIESGILKTFDFTIESPILNAVAPGEINLVKENLDFVIWIQTLETMDSVISKVPLVGYILTGKKHAPKGVILYPVEVRGNWSNPEVKYAPSLTRFAGGVWGIFKRILYAPGYIFKKLSNTKEKPVNSEFYQVTPNLNAD